MSVPLPGRIGNLELKQKKSTVFSQLNGICEGDPLSPQRGRQPKGADLLDPRPSKIFP